MDVEVNRVGLCMESLGDGARRASATAPHPPSHRHPVVLFVGGAMLERYLRKGEGEEHRIVFTLSQIPSFGAAGCCCWICSVGM